MLQFATPKLPDAALPALEMTHRSYYRARYYDPTAGRFLNEDTMRFLGGVDFYTYVENAPTDFVDPFGHSPTKPKVPFRWRTCTHEEEFFCMESCAAQGKKYESCSFAQTLRIKNLKHGPAWYDHVGDPSCSCEDPDENDNIKCKDLKRESPLQKLMNEFKKMTQPLIA